MKPLTINFAWRRGRTTERAGLAFLAAAVAIAGFVGWRDVELQRTVDARLSERQGLQRVPETAPSAVLAPKDIERQSAELKMAKSVIEQLDTPWGALFEAVESAFDEQATLLNVEPEPARREVRFTAEAKDLPAMQAYVRQLQRSPAFRDAYLASHQVNQQDPLRPVRFTAHARWVVPVLVPAVDSVSASSPAAASGDADDTAARETARDEPGSDARLDAEGMTEKSAPTHDKVDE